MDGDGQDGLVLTGKSADYLGVKGALRYEARLKVIPEGGRVYVKGHELFVEGADAVTMVLMAETNFVNYKDVSGNAHARVEAAWQKLKGRAFDKLMNDHIAAHAAMFNRAELKLEPTEGSWLPTDERMSA
jgi:alpha-L-fucosidase 2